MYHCMMAVFVDFLCNFSQLQYQNHSYLSVIQPFVYLTHRDDFCYVV